MISEIKCPIKGSKSAELSWKTSPRSEEGPWAAGTHSYGQQGQTLPPTPRDLWMEGGLFHKEGSLTGLGHPLAPMHLSNHLFAFFSQFQHGTYGCSSTGRVMGND